MQNSITTISEDKFYDEYKPIKNHLDKNAGWDGCLYETFGDELDYCFELAKKENRVWTIIECDDEDGEYPDDDENEDYVPTCFYIVSGFHYVNRIGFMVTEKQYKEELEVRLDI